jgi:TPR repeat protein
MNDIKGFVSDEYIVDYDGKTCIKIFDNKLDDKQSANYSQVSLQEMYALGEKYYLGEHGIERDYIKAVECYEKAAEQGYAPAQNGLGYCYQYGHGVSQSYEKAIECYIRAADQGYSKSQCNLGFCYKYGQGVPQDYEQAIDWFTKSAEQGYASAQNALGYCYQYGQGVLQDYKKAVEWYSKAANQNYDKAQCNLGVCYYRGHGVPQDYIKAVEWYTKAAERDYALAQYNLAVCYKNGQGVPRDLAKAMEWYTKAAEQGDNDAKKALERLKERTQNSNRVVIHKPLPASAPTELQVPKGKTTGQSIVEKEVREKHTLKILWSDSNILYIYKNTTACHTRKHNITSATAIITGKNYAEIKLNVEYCEQCNRFYMSYTTYEHYRDIYGILLGNLRMYSSMDSGGAFLASESPLKLCCYSVSQTDGLSDRERQYIISQVIDKNILQKREVIRYLEYFINMNGKKRGNEIALSKWKADLAFTLAYKSESQTHHYISTIKKY